MSKTERDPQREAFAEVLAERCQVSLLNARLALETLELHLKTPAAYLVQDDEKIKEQRGRPRTAKGSPTRGVS